MSGISNPILLQIGESEGFGNVPIYFGSLVVGYANFYALNLPQSEGSTGEIDIDVVPQDTSANSTSDVIQFYMPSTAPATECALLVGF